MTCIIGTTKFIAGDRRVIDNGKISSMVKVAKNASLIVGVCGYATTALQVKLAVRKGINNIDDIIEIVDDGLSQALVLMNTQELFKIQDSMPWQINKFETIGTGYALARGFISGRGGKITPKIAREALKFVSTQRNDCGGGCDVRMFT